MHHLYKDNISPNDIGRVINTPSYARSGYALYAFAIDGSHVNTIAPQAPLSGAQLDDHGPHLAIALDAILASDVGYLLSHAIDVLAITRTIPSFLSSTLDFPGTLAISPLPTFALQLEHLLARAAAHWLELFLLTDSMPRDPASGKAQHEDHSPAFWARISSYLGKCFTLRCYLAPKGRYAASSVEVETLRAELQERQGWIERAVKEISSLNAYDFVITNGLLPTRYSKFTGGAGAGQAQ